VTFWVGKEDADARADAASRGRWVRIMELASVRGRESGGRSESGIALASEGEDVILLVICVDSSRWYCAVGRVERGIHKADVLCSP